jgi:hypothetical protein
MQIWHINSTLKRLVIFSVVFYALSSSKPIQAQEIDAYDSLLADYATLDSLILAEIENDSSTLLSILEDIMNEDYLKSQLTLRIGYTSDITNAGRNFGIQQFGLNAGIAYYHKSGVFADVAGYYNSDQDPGYSTTITSVGYMGTIKPFWYYYASYDHFFYTQPKDSDYVITYPLTNAFNASTYFLIKGINLGLDYSFMFGAETAHRTRLNLSYSFGTKKKAWIFDRIGFNPNISVLAGNANVTTLIFNQEIAKENRQDLIQQIGRRRFFELYQTDPDLLKSMLSQEVTKNTFGIMNYSLLAPVSFRIKKSTLLLNYTINFPVALPGETNLDTTPNSYFSATYLFTFSL